MKYTIYRSLGRKHLLIEPETSPNILTQIWGTGGKGTEFEDGRPGAYPPNYFFRLSSNTVSLFLEMFGLLLTSRR